MSDPTSTTTAAPGADAASPKDAPPGRPHPSDLVGDGAGTTSVYRTDLGDLRQGDAFPLLRTLPDASVDMVFADPPFNLDKDYGAEISDDRQEDDYLRWTRRWIAQAVRVLRPGGSLFVFNLPEWLIPTGNMLEEEGMSFRHWIACRMPKGFPRGNRLKAAHYGCLYYTKGEPRVFNKVYVPIPTCRHCSGEIRDYGGHRKKLNARGLNMMDVFNAPEECFDDAFQPLAPGRGWTGVEDLWDDIPTVRHSKYKTRGANELAPIMLERLVAMATDEGDLVLDPFAGTGTTAQAAEKHDRRWLAVELGDTDAAVQRMRDFERGEHSEWESVRHGGADRASSPAQMRIEFGAPGD